MSTFIDKYGDRLSVLAEHSTVLLDGDDTGNDEWAFTQEDAKRLAIEIYKCAGGADEAPVVASKISFNEGVIRLAAIHGKEVEFRYVKNASSAPETRRFVPSSVKGAGDSLVFVGRDTDREDYRSFRLDRIRGTVGVIA